MTLTHAWMLVYNALHMELARNRILVWFFILNVIGDGRSLKYHIELEACSYSIGRKVAFMICMIEKLRIYNIVEKYQKENPSEKYLT